MQLSIHNWMRAESIETTLRRISALGYESIEIMGEPSMYDTKAIRQLLKNYKISCWGSVTLMLEERNLLAKDQGQRERSVQYVKDVVTMVKELDGVMVSVVPGTVGKIVPDGRPDEEWNWAVDAMKEVYQHSQKEGIKLGIEPINRFETYFINRGDQALALAEAVGDDCGVCLDVFHMNIEESDTYAAMERAKDRLYGFHLADNNRMGCGMGDFDWAGIVNKLKEIGYDGALAVEFSPPIDRTPASPYPDMIDENPEGLSPEAKKFLEDHGSGAVTEAFYTMLTKVSAETILPLIK
ncbi:MAG: sugar phosphate isomerase/epimerase family protein [Bacteroidota bacterium]